MAEENTNQQTAEGTNLTPSEYFDKIKEQQHHVTTDELRKSYNVILALAEKYKKLGQIRSLKRLHFLVNCLAKEENAIEAGFNTYIFKDVLEDYIENVANDVVKIIELRNYVREIPSEIEETVVKAQGIFDELYVVFTDYTKKEERRVEKERREKDPILFGCFKSDGYVADRFYVLADWEDEYCDLTLDKMIDQYRQAKNVNPAVVEQIPTTLDDLKTLLQSYVEVQDTDRVIPMSASHLHPIQTPSLAVEPEKRGLFAKVRSFFQK